MSAFPVNLRRTFVLAATLVAMGAVTGCHKKASGINPNSLGPEPATTAAPTATITADPLAIDLGQSVVLNWRTENATSVTIDGIGVVNANGTQTVSPSTSTNFHLTAKGDGGTAEANVRVTVRVPVAPTAPGPDEATWAATQPSTSTSPTSSSTTTATTSVRKPLPPSPRPPPTSPRILPSRSSSVATATAVVQPNTTWPSEKTAPTPPAPHSSAQVSRPAVSASSATVRKAVLHR